MSILPMKLKAESTSEIKEQIILSLNELDKEELTNLKWFLITRKDDKQTLKNEKEKKEEISLIQDIDEPKIIEIENKRKKRIAKSMVDERKKGKENKSVKKKKQRKIFGIKILEEKKNSKENIVKDEKEIKNKLNVLGKKRGRKKKNFPVKKNEKENSNNNLDDKKTDLSSNSKEKNDNNKSNNNKEDAKKPVDTIEL